MPSEKVETDMEEIHFSERHPVRFAQVDLTALRALEEVIA